MTTERIDVLAVSIAVVPASVIGEWRGVAYVDGTAEFITPQTYESKDEALRRAQALRPQAVQLARENAAALARVGGAA